MSRKFIGFLLSLLKVNNVIFLVLYFRKQSENRRKSFDAAWSNLKGLEKGSEFNLLTSKQFSQRKTSSILRDCSNYDSKVQKRYMTCCVNFLEQNLFQLCFSVDMIEWTNFLIAKLILFPKRLKVKNLFYAPCKLLNVTRNPSICPEWMYKSSLFWFYVPIWQLEAFCSDILYPWSAEISNTFVVG